MLKSPAVLALLATLCGTMLPGGASAGLLRSIYVDDGLHLNDAGYAIWRRRLPPHLLNAVDARAQICDTTMRRE